MAEQLISTTVHHTLPDSYVRSEAERPRLGEVVPDSDIPVVDLANPDRAAVVAQIGAACSSHGFFQVLNHGLPLEFMLQAMAVAHEFFRLSPEERAKLYSDDPANKMLKETVHNWHPLEQFVPEGPANPPQFRDVMKEVRELGFRFYAAILESMRLEQDYIEKVLGGQEQHMAVNFYPKCPSPELTYGLPAHTDPNALTILMMDQQVAGLQVLKGGRWITVNPRRNAFVINLGDQLHLQNCIHVHTQDKALGAGKRSGAAGGAAAVGAEAVGAAAVGAAARGGAAAVGAAAVGAAARGGAAAVGAEAGGAARVSAGARILNALANAISTVVGIVQCASADADE